MSRRPKMPDPAARAASFDKLRTSFGDTLSAIDGRFPIKPPESQRVL